MNRSYDLIMFDLDGTLIETAPEIADAVNDTLRRFDLPSVTQDQVDKWIGYGTLELLIQALAFANLTSVSVVRSSNTLPLIASEFNKYYEQRCGTRSKPYPFVMMTLAQLRAQGVKMAVITNKEARFTQRVLKVHHMDSLFDRVISGDSLPSKKPDPEGIFQCLHQFAITKSRALFVGDSVIDVATARNAGVAVWALDYGYNMGEPIENARPDRVLQDMQPLFQQEKI